MILHSFLSNMNNMDSMYIEPVTEEEILQLVNNAKTKHQRSWWFRYDNSTYCYTTQSYFQHLTTEKDNPR